MWSLTPSPPRTTIDSLPTEILRKILNALLTDISLGPTDAERLARRTEFWAHLSTGQEYARTLLDVAHVCRYWYDVACAYQDLWARLWVCEQDLTYIAHARQRARVAPLELYATGDRCWPRDEAVTRGFAVLAELLAKELHRVRVLDVGCAVDDWLHEEKFELPETEAPELRDLRIYRPLLAQGSPWRGLRCPKLESLEVACVADRATWDAVERNLCPPTLRRLVVRDPDRYPGAAPEPTFPSPEDLLALLPRLPNLESLAIRLPESRWTSHAQVVLPNIREITVIESNIYAAENNKNHEAFLHRLVVPATMRLQAKERAFAVHPRFVKTAPPTLSMADFLGWSSVPPALQSLTLAFHGMARTSIAGCIPGGECFDVLHGAWPLEVRAFAERCPVEGVRGLRLLDVWVYDGQYDEGRTLAAVHHLYKRLKDVEELVFGGRFGIEDVERVIGELAADGSLLPKLQTVRFDASFRLYSSSNKLAMSRDDKSLLLFRDRMLFLREARGSLRDVPVPALEFEPEVK